MNNTEVAEPPTKVKTEKEGNSSIMVLNHIEDEKTVTLSLLYIPYLDLSSKYTEKNENFFQDNLDYFTIQTMSYKNKFEDAGFDYTPKKGLVSIVKKDNNYYSLLVKDTDVTLVGGRRDYFLPFIPINDELFEEIAIEKNGSAIDKKNLLEKILNVSTKPFEQIKNKKSLLPENFRNYKVEDIV